MCGRYTLTVAANELERHFSASIDRHLYQPRYNAAPSQSLPVLCQGRSSFEFLRWGLVPSWAKSEKDAGWINARAETLTEKPAFRKAASARRCLIPATGFYEWKVHNGKKHPMHISLTDEPLFAMAGIFEGQTFAIITCEPNDFMASIHNRMPVILARESWKTWLQDMKEVPLNLMHPYNDSMRAFEASLEVNSPKNDYPDLLKEREGP